MNLRNQRDTLRAALIEAKREVEDLRARLCRKCSQPDERGELSNLVNINSDVLPTLWDMSCRMADTLFIATAGKGNDQ